MAFNVVKSAHGGVASTSTTISYTPAAAGDSLVIALIIGTSVTTLPTVAVSDTVNGSWTIDHVYFPGSGNSNGITHATASINGISASAITITVTITHGTAFDYQLMEVSGGALAYDGGSSGGAFGSSASATVSTPTLSSAAELLIVTEQNSGTAGSLTTGHGWNALTIATQMADNSAWQAVASTSSVSATYTLTSNLWTIFIAAYTGAYTFYTANRQAPISGAGTSTTPTLAYTSNPQAGDFLWAAIAMERLSALTVSSITDTQGNTWAHAVSEDNATTGTTQRHLEIWYCLQALGGGSSNTVTFHFSGNSIYGVVIHDVDLNGAYVSALDQTAVNLGTTGTPSAIGTTATLSQASEYAVAAATSSVNTALTSPLPWVAGSHTVSAPMVASEAFEVGNTAPISGSFTGGGSGVWVGCVATFEITQIVVVTPSASDSATTGDAASESNLAPISESRSDSAVTADAASAIVTASVSITDTATSGDVSSETVSAPESVTDIASSVDSGSEVINLSANLTDTASAADAGSQAVTASESITDSATTGDAAGAVATPGTVTVNPSQTDSAAAADSGTSAVSVALSQTDSNAMSDTGSIAVTASESVVDSVTAGDAASLSVTAPISRTDSVAAGDSETEAAAALLSQTDSVTTGDAGNETVNLTASAADSAAANDLGSAAVSLSTSVTNSVTSSDAGSAAPATFGSIIDTAVTGDAPSLTVSVPEAVIDSSATGDAASASISLSTTLTDTSAAGDNGTMSLAGFVSPVLTDSASAADTGSETVTAPVNLTDSLVTSDSESSAVSLFISQTDSALTNDAASAAVSVSLSQTDSDAVNDSATTVLFPPSNQVFDSAAAGDAGSEAVSLTQTVTDSAVTNDAASAVVSLSLNQTDTSATTDSTAETLFPPSNQAADSAAAGDTSSEAISVNLNVTDLTAANDASSSVISLSLNQTDSITASDVASALALAPSATVGTAADSAGTSDSASIAITVNALLTDSAAGLDTSSAAVSLQEQNDSLTQGLVGYWNLDDNLNDQSGNGHVGAWTGPLNFAPGKINDGIQLSGSNYVRVPAISGLGAVQSKSFWVYITGPVTGNQYFWDEGSNNNWVQCFISHIRCGTSVGSGFFDSNATVAVNQWYHIVVVSDGVTLYLYINGVLDKFAANAGNSSPSNLTFGSSSGANPLTGFMDEIGLWNRPLIPSEVWALYNNGLGLYPIDAAATNDLGSTAIQVNQLVSDSAGASDSATSAVSALPSAFDQATSTDQAASTAGVIIAVTTAGITGDVATSGVTATSLTTDSGTAADSASTSALPPLPPSSVGDSSGTGDTSGSTVHVNLSGADTAAATDQTGVQELFASLYLFIVPMAGPISLVALTATGQFVIPEASPSVGVTAMASPAKSVTPIGGAVVFNARVG